MASLSEFEKRVELSAKNRKAYLVALPVGSDVYINNYDRDNDKFVRQFFTKVSDEENLMTVSDLYGEKFIHYSQIHHEGWDVYLKLMHG